MAVPEFSWDNSKKKMKATTRKSEIVFTGTGTSCGIPVVSCLTLSRPLCPVCTDAVKPGSRNRRRNTGIVVRVWSADAHRFLNLVVDVGKFFWHSAIDVFPAHGIRHIDAVLLTHNHTDACGGLDDLRDFTAHARKEGDPPLPVYLRKSDFEAVKKTHYWIFGESHGYQNYITELQPVIIDSSQPIIIREIAGVTVVPLPVWHGRGYEALGFLFGKIAYISDISSCPQSTKSILVENSPLEILVLDACERGAHPSHFSLDEALLFATDIKPSKLFLVGMTHDFGHEQTNAELAEWTRRSGIPAECAWDGMSIVVDSF